MLAAKPWKARRMSNDSALGPHVLEVLLNFEHERKGAHGKQEHIDALARARTTLTSAALTLARDELDYVLEHCSAVES
jgi:hypothetical protein